MQDVITYECIKCNWTGTEAQKEPVIDGAVTHLLCPECGSHEFYMLKNGVPFKSIDEYQAWKAAVIHLGETAVNCNQIQWCEGCMSWYDFEEHKCCPSCGN